MDRQVIDKALEHFLTHAVGQERARLEFFSELWRIQDEEAARIVDAHPYDVPSTDQIVDCYWAEKPVFSAFPVRIDEADFARVCTRVAAHLGEHAGLEDEVVEGLAQVSWEDLAARVDLGIAGSNPLAFIEQCLQIFAALELPDSLPESIFAMVPAWSLRAFFDRPATWVMGAMDFSTNDGLAHTHPLFCPVCGTPATASRIGEVASTGGGARTLYCSTCGSVWPFERIRCGRCGSTNSGKLRWFHIEGDDAHRLQYCSDCGGYLRSVFVSDAEVAAPMEVEDIVMVKLDAVARDKDL